MDRPSPDRQNAARPLQANLALDVRIDDDTVDLVDCWLARHPGTELSRPDVVRYAVRQWLAEEGVPQRHHRE
jgi:hypothetical protein